MLLSITNLRVRRGDFVVALPSLRLARGELIAVTGASGSGKSMLLESLGLVARPTAGSAFDWIGRDGASIDISTLWARDDQARLARLRAGHIGFVLQTGGLLPFLTARANIVVNRRLLGLPDHHATVEHLVERLELADLLAKHPHQLSVGQRQRVAIARALAHGPELVLADEPSSSLDPRLSGRVIELLFDLAAESSVAVVLATHEQDRVRGLGLRELRADCSASWPDCNTAFVDCRPDAP